MRKLLFSALVVMACVRLSESAVPTIHVVRSSSQVEIDFTGTLLTAPNVNGPWTEVTNAVSPYRPADNIAGFFRASPPKSIFASETVVALTITGPLQTYFEKAFAGMPDGIIPPVREKPWFDGLIQVGGQNIPVTLRVRGNSSLQECPFPKLKFKVSSNERIGTPFFDAREVKIGTHCAEGGRGPIGRLREQIATYREALAYETMELLGFVTPRVRRAVIDYRDISPTNDISEVGWDVTRTALILDDPEVIGQRLGGQALDDEEVAAIVDAKFAPQLLVDLHLFHALLGNWDYALAQSGRELWNTDVIKLPDGTQIPVAGDFDLASFVTERVQLNAPWDYHPELPDLERQMLYRLEYVRALAGGESFATGVNRFAAKRASIENKISTAVVDEIGRTNATHHVAAFFEAAEALTGKR